jgi:hypothetical protein
VLNLALETDYSVVEPQLTAFTVYMSSVQSVQNEFPVEVFDIANSKPAGKFGRELAAMIWSKNGYYVMLDGAE